MTSPAYECSLCSEIRGIPNTSVMGGINPEVPKRTWGRELGITQTSFCGWEGLARRRRAPRGSFESVPGVMCSVGLWLPLRSSQWETLGGAGGEGCCRQAEEKRARQKTAVQAVERC